MEYSLSAEKREILGKKVKSLRQNNSIPAVVYGKGLETQHISLSLPVFTKLYAQAGTSTLVNLKIGDEKLIKVLVREPQIDPIYSKPVHVDFYQVNMKEKIRTEIPLEFIGESPVVIDMEGKLVHNMDTIEVECLPEDLVQHIEVDLSKLLNFDDAIHVSELNVPEKIEVLTDPELVVVVAQAPISEAELEAELAEPVSEEEAVAAVEVEEGVAAEGEEGETAEGAEGAKVKDKE